MAVCDIACDYHGSIEFIELNNSINNLYNVSLIIFIILNRLSTPLTKSLHKDFRV